jgi:hypothetical protein
MAIWYNPYDILPQVQVKRNDEKKNRIEDFRKFERYILEFLEKTEER